MTVESSSEVQFDLLSNFESTGMVDSRLHLRRGTVHTRVPKRNPRSRFEVSTPASVAAVRGTEFRVSVMATSEGSENGMTGTKHEVYESEIRVAKDKEERALPAGKGLLATEHSPLPAAIPLPPAPRFSDNREQIVMPYEMRWQAVTDAVGYTLRLASIETENALTLIEGTTKNVWLVDGLDHGCYRVTVSAVDRQRFQGMPAKRKLCVKQSLAPPQALTLSNEARSSAQRLSWHAVEYAQAYRVELSSDPEFNQVDKALATRSPATLLHPAKNQTQFARVIALGREGIQSEASDTLQVSEKQTSDKGHFAALAFWVLMVLSAL